MNRWVVLAVVGFSAFLGPGGGKRSALEERRSLVMKHETQRRKICPNCGATFTEKDANFCPEDGTRLEEEEAPLPMVATVFDEGDGAEEQEPALPMVATTFDGGSASDEEFLDEATALDNPPSEQVSIDDATLCDLPERNPKKG
jgi:hypothetical protein